MFDDVHRRDDALRWLERLGFVQIRGHRELLEYDRGGEYLVETDWSAVVGEFWYDEREEDPPPRGVLELLGSRGDDGTHEEI